MKGSLLKIKNLPKYLFIILITGLILYSIYDAIKPNSFILNINIVPQDATVKLNGKLITKDKYHSKYKKGKYVIAASKDGFVASTQEIVLSKDSNINIELIQNTELLNKSVKTIRSTPISNIVQLDKDIIYGIDATNGNLVSIKDGVIDTIYQGRVREYSIKNGIAVILDERDFAKLTIINLLSKNQNSIDLSDIQNLVSVTLSDDAKTIYALGSFSIETKKPALYSITISSPKPTKIYETLALKIEYVDNNKIALFEDVHSLNKGVFHLLDLNNLTDLYSANANDFAFSKDQKHVVLELSDKLSVVDLTNIKEISIPFTYDDRYLWMNDNTIIILKNTFDNNIEIASFDITSTKLSPYKIIVSGEKAQHVYGILENKLYYQNYDGIIRSVDLNL